MNYITTQIFTDNRINIIADRLFYYLNEKFTFDFVKEKIVLSGHCSAILQEAEVSPTANNVVFFCVNSEIYNFLLLEVSKILNPKICMKFKERILLDFDFVKIEIWFQETGMDAINYEVSNVFIHSIDKIPSIIL
ncbi:hypothetical protein GFJ99_11580 [Flavobacterium sp. LMO6]|uniref:Uncharacterized protein n=1 Tax=Flavobacterium phage vB_FspS_laban6-1 TaxID=2686250 RepID=A0A6B9LJ42_9CAUD|nr:hypothetical protein [Flavobacterium sp. LMO6]YP_009854802.1 hypothetical protein HWC90_gp04 [Flavobacterium phage vB_FspS_laban6-1]MQP63335.1 hypothetical protein [Flavobacterium sp. LMO6]QHB38975.1 hypothetical protein laban61_gp004 [Flavobacterium phage vB_FspS_laban6-1]